MYTVTTEEFDHLTLGDLSLRARIYRPAGDGPFPAYVDLHGGAWFKGGYANNDPINRALAARGVVVMAADYRLPPEGTYPASVADANHAVRWLKLNAARFGTRADMVGIMGTSAGGHLAVLTALKPFDPRYAALPLEGGAGIDARVASVVALWPVICPATRYQENLEREARGDTSLAGRAGAGHGQMTYWLNEATMQDGSPVYALERGDPIDLPDMLYVQGAGDALHLPRNMDRFIAGYRKAGGQVETELMEGDHFDAPRSMPGSALAQRVFDHIAEFASGARRTGEDPAA
nr:alpha/beta hydrolase [Puniceibacterium confluentis]